MKPTALWVFCLAAGLAEAATITVDSLADDVSENGSCSLREAVIAANTNTGSDCVAGDAGQDTIDFVEGLTGSIGFSDSQPLAITESLVLNGPGSSVLTVDAGGLSRVFHATLPAAGQLSFSGVTLRGGNAEGDGGGLLIEGNVATVAIDGVRFEENTATGRGGALGIPMPDDLQLTITATEFVDNHADVSGGAVYQGSGTKGTALEVLFHETRLIRNTNPRAASSVEAFCSADCLITFDTNEFSNHSGHAMGLTMLGQESQDQILFRNNEVRRNLSDSSGRSNGPGGLLIEASGGQTLIYNNLFFLLDAEFAGGIALTGGSPTQRFVVGFNAFWSGECSDAGGESCGTAVYAQNATAILYANYFYQELAAATCSVSQDGTGSIESAGYNLAQFSDNSCVNLEQASATDRVASGSTRPGAGGSMSFFDSFRGPTARTDEVADTVPAPCTLPPVDLIEQGMVVATDYTGQPRALDHDGDGTADCDVGPTELAPLVQSEQLGQGDGDLFLNAASGYGRIFTWDTELNAPDGGAYSERINAPFTLSARPDSGSRFAGFSDGCLDIRENNGFTICDFAGDEAKTISATFEPLGSVYELSVTLTGTGLGVVTSEPKGIDCGTQCSSFFPAMESVSLRADTLENASFVRWEGDCEGSGVCQLTMDQDRQVIAVFLNPDILFSANFEVPDSR